MQPDLELSPTEVPAVDASQSHMTLLPRPGDEHDDLPLGGAPEVNAWQVPVEAYAERFMRPVELKRRLTVLKADQGVGKTEQGLRALTSSRRVVLLTHRRSLAADLQQRFNRLSPNEPANHYLKVDLGSAEGNIVIVVNSLPRLDVARYHGATVYIDEVTQLLDSLQDEIFDDRRANVLETLCRLLSGADRVVVADKDVDQDHVDLLASWMSIKADDTQVIVNNYVLGGSVAYFHETLDTWLAALSESASSGNRVFVASDEKAKIESMAHALQQRGLRTLTIVGDQGTPERDRALQDINSAVADTDALLVSPALFTGVDITDEKFGDVFLLATGVTGAIRSSDFMQAAHRVRHPMGSIHVWVGDKRPQVTTSAAAIAATMDSLPVFALMNFRDRDFIRAAWSYRNYFVRSAVARNRDVLHLFPSLIAAMKAAGHPVCWIEDPETDVRSCASTVQLEFVLTEPHKVYAALDRPQADAITEVLQAVHQLRKADEAGNFVLNVAFPQQASAGFLARYFYKLNGHSWAALEQIIRHPDPRVLEREIENFEAAVLPRDVINQRASRRLTESLGIRQEDLGRRAALLREVLETLGGEFRRTAPITKEEQSSIRQVLQRHEHTLAHSFGQRVPAPDRVLLTLGRLLKKVGLGLVSTRTGSRTDRVRTYRLDAHRAELMYDLVERRESRRKGRAEPTSSIANMRPLRVHNSRVL